MYTTMYDGLTNLLAPKTNPTFTGDMTFPNGKVISQTEEDTTFWKDVTFNGTVTFPDTSTITDYLKSATAATTYLTTSSAASTYAPKASPTFTGTISLNGDVTLASASANTITLNDHLVLCTGSNFTAPLSVQQGYIMTGTLEADGTAITSATATKYATLPLTYGVWLIIGQIGYFNVNNSATNTSASISNKYTSIHTTDATATAKTGQRLNYTKS